ncbi:hypothetical protein SAMN02745975_02113 [Geosporobacter subterraneus DSM 17957]|uniref:Signal transducing protein n=1 Tax=Geosporobacter subterraneus DSM 17957 TaxID=1121919 RepID=A0A1M6JCW2_9FIRM|nr:hypothetical protein [Geosporobacter subterraneus]SHJ44551.1 hypothetical protein SAMN02745975_02113 [Geosporobacter subterraneus DSM 17957]
MWTVVYMAHNQADGEKIKDLLGSEGFLVKIRAIGKEDDRVYEVLVPNGEVQEAHDVLVDLGY